MPDILSETWLFPPSHSETDIGDLSGSPLNVLLALVGDIAAAGGVTSNEGGKGRSTAATAAAAAFSKCCLRSEPM